MKIKTKNGEKFIRIDGGCPCKNERETCNFCKWKPENPEKHKHIFNCSEYIYNGKVRWFGKMFNQKEITIIKSCLCGKEGKTFYR